MNPARNFKEEQHPRAPRGARDPKHRGGRFVKKPRAAVPATPLQFSNPEDEILYKMQTGLVARRNPHPGNTLRPASDYEDGEWKNVTAPEVVHLANGLTVIEKNASEDPEVQEIQSNRQEQVAYILSRELGFDIVPPTTYDAKTGRSRQLFIDGAHTVEEDNRPTRYWCDMHPDEAAKIAVLDYINLNWDRHDGNLLIHPAGERLVAVDNGAMPTKDVAQWKEQSKYKSFTRTMRGRAIPSEIRLAVERFMIRANDVRARYPALRGAGGMSDDAWEEMISRMADIDSGGVFP